MPKSHRTTTRVTHQPSKAPQPTHASEIRILIASLAPVQGNREQMQFAMNRNLDQVEVFIKEVVLAPDGLGTFKEILKEINAIRTLMQGSVYDKALPALADGLITALDTAAHEDFVMD